MPTATRVATTLVSVVGAFAVAFSLPVRLAGTSFFCDWSNTLPPPAPATWFSSSSYELLDDILVIYLGFAAGGAAVKLAYLFNVILRSMLSLAHVARSRCNLGLDGVPTVGAESFSSIVHDAQEVVGGTCVSSALFREVEPHTTSHVLPANRHIPVPILPGLLMHDAQCMECLMNCYACDLASSGKIQILCSTSDVSKRGKTTTLVGPHQDVASST